MATGTGHGGRCTGSTAHALYRHRGRDADGWPLTVVSHTVTSAAALSFVGPCGAPDLVVADGDDDAAARAGQASAPPARPWRCRPPGWPTADGTCTRAARRLVAGTGCSAAAVRRSCCPCAPSLASDSTEVAARSEPEVAPSEVEEPSEVEVEPSEAAAAPECRTAPHALHAPPRPPRRQLTRAQYDGAAHVARPPPRRRAGVADRCVRCQR